MIKVFVTSDRYHKIRWGWLKHFACIDPMDSQVGSPQGNVSRKTFYGRLHCIDKIVSDICLPSFGRSQIRFIDIGCSTGVTSYDSYKYFEKRGFSVSMAVNDPFSIVSVLKIGGFFTKYISSSTSEVISIRLLRFISCINNPKFPISFFLYHALAHLNLKCKYVGSVNYFIPEVAELVRTNDWALVDTDFFKHKPGSDFDIVRVANLLNAGLFPRNRVRRFVAHVREAVDLGGYVVVARDNCGIHYTVFQKRFCSVTQRSRLFVVVRSEKGCDLEESWLEI